MPFGAVSPCWRRPSPLRRGRARRGTCPRERTLRHLYESSLQHLRCQGNNAHELLVTQFAAHGPEDARTARLELVVDQHRGVLVKLDVGTVGTTLLLGRANDDAANHVTLLHGGPGDRLF